MKNCYGTRAGAADDVVPSPVVPWSVQARRVCLSVAAVLLLCVGASAFVSTARADAGALLPVLTERGVAEQEATEARDTALRYFAALPEAIPLTSSQDGVRRAGARYGSCGEPACASAYARALGVDLSIAIRVFAPDQEALLGGVSVALVTAEGTAFTGNVKVDEHGIGDATQRALGLAYERWRRGPGPWLSVDGPAGSRLRIDDRPLALLPYTDKHEPGLHQLRVEDAAGVPLYDRAIYLPDDANHHERIHVEASSVPSAEATAAPLAEATAAPISESPPSTPTPYWQRKRSRWNYIVGIPLALTGAFYASVGIAHFAKRGSCAEELAGQCVRQNKVDAGSRAALALGLAGLAVGGGVFLGVGVVRERDQSNAALVHLRGRF